MKCDLCQGDYEERLVTRSYKRGGQAVVVEDVPALVCNRCGDILLAEETVAQVQRLLKEAPQGSAPLYRFPQRARR